MATLQEKTTQACLQLRSLHIFGRHPHKADTLIEDAGVSHIHASIRWDGLGWLLYDHSRNGTYVNTRAVGTPSSFALSPGDTIRFAAAAKQWIVLDVDPPRPLLLPDDPALPAIVLAGVQFLPDALQPESAIYQDEHGHWLHETVDGCQRLRDGDVLEVHGRRWHYVNGITIEATGPLQTPRVTRGAATRFRFDVSQNEEHVETSIAIGPALVELGERSHHYCLLTLARQRVLDAQRGFDRYSQGWLAAGQLVDMLRIDTKHLNMQLHRARHQISQALPANLALARFIERRRGELRFGSFAFEIRLGGRLEAAFDPSRRQETPDGHTVFPA